MSFSLPGPSGTIAGAVPFDADGDADLDFLVTGSTNHFYQNEGSPTFSEMSGDAAFPFRGPSIGAIAGDYEDDGDVDVYLLNPGKPGTLLRNDGSGRFEDATAAAGLASAPNAVAATWADLENDGRLDLVLAPQDGTVVQYVNKGDGTFAAQEIAPTAGSTGVTTFTLVFVDDNPFLDLLLITSAGPKLFLNANGTFTDVTATSKLAPTLKPAVVLPVDFNNDQSVDLILGGPDGVQLLKNTHRKTFADSSSALGAKAIGPVKSLQTFELDNDGFLDLIVLPAAGGIAVYRNDKGEGFVKVTEALNLPASGDFKTLSVGDFNRDGKLDAYAGADRAGGRLFTNHHAKNPYFMIHLLGNESTSDGVGAKVTLSSEKIIMFRQIGGGGSMIATQAPDPFFGLGATPADRYTLAIKWPSGILQFENIEKERVVNRILNAKESAKEAPWAEC